MSVRKRRIRFSHQAQSDYDDILLYTSATFGDAQAAAYEAKLALAFDRLRTWPESGTSQAGGEGTVRVLVVGSHRIWYSINGDDIEVANIAHVRQDRPPRHT